MSNQNISFTYCDYSNTEHRKNLTELINHYMTDPMGDVKPLDEKGQLQLIEGLANHPSSFVLFAYVDNQIAGLTTCFINFSTFKAKKFINIHDVVVFQQFRGHGVGRKLVEVCCSIAKERDYCKVTLEVREDNIAAKKLYQSLGFCDDDPILHFWTKII